MQTMYLHMDMTYKSILQSWNFEAFIVLAYAYVFTALLSCANKAYKTSDRNTDLKSLNPNTLL